MNTRRSFQLLLAALALCASAPLDAQTLYDGNGGPLLAGQLYVAPGSLTVPVGETLTCQPGSILKFTSGRLIVNGTLVMNGSAGQEVFFTSITDDSVGGDTNTNGPSSGSAGEWDGIQIAASGSLSATNAVIRFAGAGGWAPIYHTAGGALSLQDCVIENALGAGIDLTGNSQVPSISGCSIDGNGGYAVRGARLDVLPGFANNTAAGNSLGDVIEVAAPSPSGDVTLTQANCINEALVFKSNCSVASGRTLRVEAGVVVKFPGAFRFIVQGDLELVGTDLDPVVLTSLADDEYAGDTNVNGLSSGQPGDWSGIEVLSTGTLSASHARVRYAGASGWTPIYNSGGVLTLDSCVIEDASGAGLDLNSIDAPVTISNCSFEDNGGVAVVDAKIDTLPGFTDNSASGNLLGDTIHVSAPTPSGDVTLVKSNCLNGALVFKTNCSVANGLTLRLEEGLAVKFSGAFRLIVQGNLDLAGTAEMPVVLTSLADDDYAGDTNADGPSSGLPGDWSGVEVPSTGVLSASHARVRYAGASGWAPVYGSGGALTLADCVLEHALGAGLDLNGIDAQVSISDCAFENNGGFAVRDARIDTVPGFRNNSASGNAQGDTLLVTIPSPTGDVTIAKENCLGGVLLFSTNSSIASGKRLEIGCGVIVKWTGGFRFSVAGTLDLAGTAFEPVVVTSGADDAFGGDTQGDGLTSGSAGDWAGIEVTAAGSASLENVLVRFAGAGGYSGVYNFSPSTTLRSVRVEHSLGNGFHLNALGTDAVNLVAFDCTGNGIQANAGAFGILHATSYGNTGFGIRSLAAHAGDVLNSIAWANGAGNFDGYSAGETRYCDGSPSFAGLNGNLNLDPLFVDPSLSVGDLRLGAGSPCIDTADLLTAMAVVKDHAEHSRALDPAATGAVLPDMGAHEAFTWEMSLVSGEPRLGSAMKFRVDGPAGTSIYLLGTLNGSAFSSNFGFRTCGASGVQLLGSVPVGRNFRIVIPPDPGLAGLAIGVQTRTFRTGTPGVGALTNLYRKGILPAHPRKGPGHLAAALPPIPVGVQLP